MPKIGNPRLEIRTSDVRTHARYIAPIYTADRDPHITHRDSSSGCVRPRSGGPIVRNGRADPLSGSADLRSGGPHVRSGRADPRSGSADVRSVVQGYARPSGPP